MSNDHTAELIASRLFDADWYSEEYRDVSILRRDPAEHYLAYGRLLSRQPGPAFDALVYLRKNPDVAAAHVDPLAHFLSSGEAEGRQIVPVRDHLQLPSQTRRLEVTDLEAKLWGGFSELARTDLNKVLGSKSYSTKDRARAAFVLARWFATQEDWSSALRYLNKLKSLDVNLSRSRKSKLLMVECLLSAGEFDRAESRIAFELDRGTDGDFALAMNNLILKAQGPQAGDARLEALNAHYREHDLLPVSLLDPERGVVFDNLRCEVPSTHFVKDGPKVSILMPVYEAGEFIDVALNSLLSQTWRNLEIVAVDDCSGDGSWERLQHWAEQDPRLRIARNSQNSGAYPTRNRALDLADGDIITVHDSDDWSHPQMIEQQVRELLGDERLKVTCSHMARVYPDMRAILRPQRGNLEYVHRSYPSVMMRRADISLLGRWDDVSANADDEFVQRARLLWGKEALRDILPTVPLSFFLVHEKSLTQQKGTSLNSLTFGIRREYARQASYWRERAAAEHGSLGLRRTNLKSPFPIPQGLAPKNWPRNSKYDVVIVTDMSLLGGTRRCNEGYITAMAEMGLRVGLFHWPRYDLRLAPVSTTYLDLAYHENVDILVPEDEVDCRLVLIHHPPILDHAIDALPAIRTESVAILVNQSPMQRHSQAPFYYDMARVDAFCAERFGSSPTWLPIAPHVRDILCATGPGSIISPEIWSPPFNGELATEISPPADLGANRPIVIGRHARSHWTKWPASPAAIRAAYCADAEGVETRILGGATEPERRVGGLPENWTVLPFDSVGVSEFLSGLDFCVHYTHPDYIEEFGRNIMEAMAASRVVILPKSFRAIFGDAAVYASPDAVSNTARSLWADPDAYRVQAERGLDFVRKRCGRKAVSARLHALIPAEKQNLEGSSQ